MYNFTHNIILFAVKNFFVFYNTLISLYILHIYIFFFIRITTIWNLVFVDYSAFCLSVSTNNT